MDKVETFTLPHPPLREEVGDGIAGELSAPMERGRRTPTGH
jgi:hypothetical protein